MKPTRAPPSWKRVVLVTGGVLVGIPFLIVIGWLVYFEIRQARIHDDVAAFTQSIELPRRPVGVAWQARLLSWPLGLGPSDMQLRAVADFDSVEAVEKLFEHPDAEARGDSSYTFGWADLPFLVRTHLWSEVTWRSGCFQVTGRSLELERFTRSPFSMGTGIVLHSGRRVFFVLESR